MAGTATGAAVSIATALFAVLAGITCLLIGRLRRRVEDRGTLVLLYVGGLALVLAGGVSLT